VSTPRELLGIRDDLAKKVAEGQLDRHDAVATLRDAVATYPEQMDKLADDWADTELDRSVKKYLAKRNKSDNAEIVRKLAELGMEAPTLDGEVIPISEYDESYKVTLGDRREWLDTNIASAWRLLSSFERREMDNEVLLRAVGADGSLTGEQALDILKGLPDVKRKTIRMEVEAEMDAKRRLFLRRRYGDYGQVAEG
jgi:hypothetical protein